MPSLTSRVSYSEAKDSLPKGYGMKNSVFKKVFNTGGKKYRSMKKCQPKSLKGKKFDLMVIRYCEDGNSSISRPCNSCLEHLKSFGIIDKVYYFDKDKNLRMEKLNNMEPGHVSRGFLALDSISK
jgi:hypothetical protein